MKPSTQEREKREQKQRSERGGREAIIDFYEKGGNIKKEFYVYVRATVSCY